MNDDNPSGEPIPFPAVDRPTDADARELGFVDALDWYRKSTKSSIRGDAVPEVEYRSLPPPVLDPDDVEFEVPGGPDVSMIAWEESGRSPRDYPGVTSGVTVEGERVSREKKIRILFAHEERM